jgi:hypothetical protein
VSYSTVEMRKCKTCAAIKILSENFRPHTVKGKVYFEYECRLCGNSKAKQWHHDNKDHVHARNKAARAADPEKFREKRLIEYRRDRVGRLKRRAKQRFEAGDRIRELDRAASKRWRAAHPFETKQWSAMQRAIKRKAQTKPIKKKEIEELFRKQKGRCAICKKKLTKYHLDHIEPLCKGGAHELHNFQFLCPTCNLRKRHSDPIDYMQKLGFLL